MKDVRGRVVAIALLAVGLGVCSTVTNAAEISYQGYLEEMSGQPVNGSVRLEFGLHSSSEPGSPVLWSEMHERVRVQRGVFDVVLGAMNPLDLETLSRDPLWLETAVNGSALSPLRKLRAVPRAYYAERAALADSALHVPISPGATAPVGALVLWTNDLPPAGWLLCDGSAVSRTTYATLFAVIGIQFGPGDGSSTFNLPDGRGRFLLGQDDMGGSAAGRVTQPGGAFIGGSGGTESISVGPLPFSGSTGGASPRVWVDDNSGGDDYWVSPDGHTHTFTGATTPVSTNVLNPYLTLNLIIRY
jgi:hypothetical protein